MIDYVWTKAELDKNYWFLISKQIKKYYYCIKYEDKDDCYKTQFQQINLNTEKIKCHYILTK